MLMILPTIPLSSTCPKVRDESLISSGSLISPELLMCYHCDSLNNILLFVKNI